MFLKSRKAEIGIFDFVKLLKSAFLCNSALNKLFKICIYLDVLVFLFVEELYFYISQKAYNDIIKQIMTDPSCIALGNSQLFPGPPESLEPDSFPCCPRDQSLFV